MKTLLFFAFCFISSSNICAQVYVKADATGLNDGTSWQNAFTDLSVAINTTISGEIWIAAGVYKPSTDYNGVVPTDNRLKTFRLKRNILLYGGFAGNEVSFMQRNPTENKTVLSGDIGITGDSTDNTYHVLTNNYISSADSTVLDGITVTKGQANLCYASERDGAGIYISYSPGTKFIIRNCVFENNNGCQGGAMYIFNAVPVIENCLFKKNKGTSGGAIYLDHCNAIIRNNVFTENTADGTSTSLQGGAIYISAYSSPIITNNLFTKNYARNQGGAIDVNTNYHTTIANNIITENKSKKGGGIYLDFSQTYFFNNVIARNYATEYGGAIYVNYAYDPKFINNTIALNKAGVAGGGAYMDAGNVKFINSILYYNTSPDGKQVNATTMRSDWFPHFYNSSIENGKQGILSTVAYDYINSNNIAPEFTDTANLNFHLLPVSGLINAGTLDSTVFNYPWKGSNGEKIAFAETDPDGNARIYNGQIDIGAYELTQMQEYRPTNLQLSNTIVNRNAAIGTLVGRFTTTDPDSEIFSYTLLNNSNCFAIDNDFLITECLLKDYYHTDTVTIKVKSTDNNGWAIEKDFDIALTDMATGIAEPTLLPISFYPNPTTGIVSFKGNVNPDMTIKVYSSLGNLIYFTKLTSTKAIDLSPLKPGLYFLVFTCNKKTYHEKLIKL